MSAPTVKDVAREAQVSPATVSRVAHGRPVNEATRDRVLQVMARLEYSPNLAARSLRTHTTGTVACVLRGVLMSGMADFFRAAEGAMRQAGYTLMLTSTDEDVGNQRQLLKLLASRGVDGLFFTAAADQDKVLNQAISELRVPVVVIDRDASFAADAVTIDHRAGTMAAMRHLLALGHRRIGLLTLPASIRPGRERAQAYAQAMAEAGIAVRPGWVRDQCVDDESTSFHADALLGQAEAPTAVIAGGMALLGPLLSAARVRRLDVPNDLSIVAGADSEVAALMPNGITAVRWDVSGWGRTSARLLLDRIQGTAQAAERHVVLPTELVLRGSTGAARERA